MYTFTQVLKQLFQSHVSEKVGRSKRISQFLTCFSWDTSKSTVSSYLSQFLGNITTASGVFHTWPEIHMRVLLYALCHQNSFLNFQHSRQPPVCLHPELEHSLRFCYFLCGHLFNPGKHFQLPGEWHCPKWRWIAVCTDLGVHLCTDAISPAVDHQQFCASVIVTLMLHYCFIILDLNLQFR